jgi:SPP1 gp7 family putative phage head morphogenesis protein
MNWVKRAEDQNLFRTDRGILLLNDVKDALSAFSSNPSDAAKVKEGYEQLMKNGRVLAHKTAAQGMRAIGKEMNANSTADIHLEAVAIAADKGYESLLNVNRRYADEASQIIQQSIILGHGFKRTSTEMAKRLGVTKSKASHSVRTVSMQAFNGAKLDAYAEEGIKYGQVIATQDSRVCPICADRGGNVYNLKDIILPFHGSCRCTVIAVDKLKDIDKEWADKHSADLLARAGKTDSRTSQFERLAGLERAPKPKWASGQSAKAKAKTSSTPKKRVGYQGEAKPYDWRTASDVDVDELGYLAEDLAEEITEVAGEQYKPRDKYDPKMYKSGYTGDDFTLKGRLEIFAQELEAKAPGRAASIRDALQAKVDEASSFVRVSPGALDKIIDSERFKTLYETGSSGGLISPNQRLITEKVQFDLPYDTPAELRPISGYRSSKAKMNSGTLSSYGSIAVKLKPQVDSRSTITFGDSLAAMGYSPATNLKNIHPGSLRGMLSNMENEGPNFDKKIKGAKGIEGAAIISGEPYMEIQVHGGLMLEDIESVTIPASFKSSGSVGKTIERLKEKGIEVIYE